MMFSSTPSSTLGKSNCLKCKPYIPSFMDSMDSMNISFKQAKNSAGNVNFVAIVENDDENIELPKDMQIDEEADKLYENEKIYSPSEKEPDIFSLDNDYIKTFYVGSITVVGLYILFRILNKTK